MTSVLVVAVLAGLALALAVSSPEPRPVVARPSRRRRPY